MLLLNPGPVTLSERVRRSLLQPDLCHRENEFFDLQDDARRRLLSLYDLDPGEWTGVLITASGTAAVESMVAALVPQNGRLLICENGVYGERIAQIAAQYGIPHDRVIAPWMEALNVDEIAARLAARCDATPDGSRFTHVAIVHHETTTGRLNDLGAIAALCKTRGLSLLIDGVSSFGAEAIPFADATVAAVAGTANKCLHGAPGVSFVIARRSALSRAASRTYYLDLGRLARLQDQRSTPFTPAVHIYYALVEALREFAEGGGRRARYQRYAALAEQVRAGLARLDIDMVIPIEQSSVVLRAYHLPRGVTYATLHDAVKKSGFVIYAGQGDLSSMLFRISTMGELTPQDMERLLQSVARLVT